MITGPTHSDGSAAGLGAPGGRALRGLSKCSKQADKHLFDGSASSNPLCPPSKGEVVNWQCDKQFDKQKFAEQLDAPKAFSSRRRWQPEGLTDEVVCDSTNSPKPLMHQRFCLPHTSSVAYGDSFSLWRSRACQKVLASPSGRGGPAQPGRRGLEMNK